MNTLNFKHLMKKEDIERINNLLNKSLVELNDLGFVKGDIIENIKIDLENENIQLNLKIICSEESYIYGTLYKDNVEIENIISTGLINDEFSFRLDKRIINILIV